MKALKEYSEGRLSKRLSRESGRKIKGGNTQMVKGLRAAIALHVIFFLTVTGTVLAIVT